MILGFSVKFPKGKGSLSGKKTFFPEKIWKGIMLKKLVDSGFIFLDYKFKSNYHINGNYNGTPKLHTMRDDEKKRWKVGMKIHFNIWVRTKNMFRFAPILEVISLQDVEIVYSGFGLINVIIDGRGLTKKEIETLAINDGFDSVDDFFEWFNESWKGVLIHWTDLKY